MYELQTTVSPSNAMSAHPVRLYHLEMQLAFEVPLMTLVI